MKVSVVTPSFNQGRFIRATIDSVLGQGCESLEYFVVDGGSQDETVSVLREYGNNLSWVSERDKGQTDAINKGMRQATGDIVAYLNSDDVYLPGTLNKVVDIFQRHPQVDFIYGDFHAIDEKGDLIDVIRTIPYVPDILLYDCNYICQPASFYRRSLLDKIGLFDDSLRFLMDYEFFLRASKRRVGFHFHPEALSAIRFHGDCKTLSDGVYPWAVERQRIIVEYCRPKAHHPSALKLLRAVYRAKRYMHLLARGRLDVANLKLARRLREIAA